MPPARGRDHALRIVRDLLAREPVGRGTDLALALRFAQRVMRRRGIVALISDFQAEGWEKAIGALRRRHDVVALHLADPRESDVPAAGLVAFTDPETGARVVADTARPEVRRALRAPGFDAARRRVQEDASRCAGALDGGVVRPAAAGLLQGAGAPALMLAAALAAARAHDGSRRTPRAQAPRRARQRRVTATASKTEVTVGETFTIELKATGPAGTTYTFAGEASADAARAAEPGGGSRRARARAGDAPLPGRGLRARRAAASRRSPCATGWPTARRARRRRRRSR